MTADQYRRRIARAFKAVEWGRSNPYRELQQQRLEADRAEHRREVAECKAEGGTPF